jgi:plastocyanin
VHHELRKIAQLRAVRVLTIGLIFLPVASARAASRTVEVVIEHFAFVPSSVDVAPGDTVVFINRDIAPHTATAVDGSWTTADISGGKSERFVVRAAGAYFCRYHPAMRGQLDMIGEK